MTDGDTGSPADVCLVLEGSYPFVMGGVSSWAQQLMTHQPNLDFSAVAIVANNAELTWKYSPPVNLKEVRCLSLGSQGHEGRAGEDAAMSSNLAEALIAIVSTGRLSSLSDLIDLIDAPRSHLELDDLINSPLAFQVVRSMYQRMMPGASFLQFYWAWRALFGGLFATLRFEPPPSRLVHTVSTGFAGLVAARAVLARGSRAILTEHGIYTNERRIEIAMADWIADRVDAGFLGSSAEFDIRELWMQTFEAYARICYGATDSIISLNGSARAEQLALGALGERTRIIPNGVDPSKFATRREQRPSKAPVIAFIGRVVPIKDVHTYIHAVALLHDRHPDLEALVLGPGDEDEEYFLSCKALVSKLGLESVVLFKGTVDVKAYLPRVDVVVLTSISEAQPLVILEAGGAGVPCVATDTGSCRELILGGPDESPAHGIGGTITGLVAPVQTADAVAGILNLADRGRRLGRNLRRRVRAHYRADDTADAYSDLYRTHLQEIAS